MSGQLHANSILDRTIRAIAAAEWGKNAWTRPALRAHGRARQYEISASNRHSWLSSSSLEAYKGHVKALARTDCSTRTNRDSSHEEYFGVGRYSGAKDRSKRWRGYANGA